MLDKEASEWEDEVISNRGSKRLVFHWLTTPAKSTISVISQSLFVNIPVKCSKGSLYPSDVAIRKQHDNVVKFVHYFEDRAFVHLLLELCPQKTLLHVSKYRKQLEECEVRYYTRQIMQGLNYIHTKKILHRDLKLGNMFLSANMAVKIGDFGLASTIAGKMDLDLPYGRQPSDLFTYIPSLK